MEVVDFLVEKDKEWLLVLNNGHNVFEDNFWWSVSLTWPWLFALVVLVFVLVRSKSWEALWVLGGLALCVALADQLSSGLIKPLVERFRPTHEPTLQGLVETVRGYEGGSYGFVSSHAANTFGVAAFLTLVTRRKVLAVTLFGWAVLTCYSRIYLGVHYPGDIICGALIGAASGWLAYIMLRKVRNKAVNEGEMSKKESWIAAMSLVLTTLIMAIVAAMCV